MRSCATCAGAEPWSSTAVVLHGSLRARRSAETRAGGPKAANLPEGIGSWLHWIDEREEKAGYRSHHSDGGEDDDPAEHAAWAKKLEAMGRNPGSPWKAQMAAIGIDQERDAISDSGEEIWNLLEQRGVKNILLVGVHTNMCVLGRRPFGLRQMAKNGKNVALVRDLTDTMYNPERPPQVSHFHGTDLVIRHIEKYVCPTLTSDQILGGNPMKFRGDARKDLVLIMAEQGTTPTNRCPLLPRQSCARTSAYTMFLPPMATRTGSPAWKRSAGRTPRSSACAAAPAGFSSPRCANSSPASKPVIGIRTASQAFALRKGEARRARDVPEFDAEVWGGNYDEYHGNNLKTFATPAKSDHAILNGIAAEFPSGGSLYKTSPLKPGATPLVVARAPNRSIRRNPPRGRSSPRAAFRRILHLAQAHRGF
ncbi:MAG: hypothetical protein R3F11_24090 [Verrucomicrobiales bacterium]